MANRVTLVLQTKEQKVGLIEYITEHFLDETEALDLLATSSYIVFKRCQP